MVAISRKLKGKVWQVTQQLGRTRLTPQHHLNWLVLRRFKG